MIDLLKHLKRDLVHLAEETFFKWFELTLMITVKVKICFKTP